jgi:hypothetical protein
MNSNTPDQTDITLIEEADFFSGSDDTMEFIGRTVAYDEAGKLAPKSITIGNNTKPKPRGKVLAHDKLNTARKLYAKKRDGDAFIDDNHVLFAANEIAKELANKDATVEEVRKRVEATIRIYEFDLTDDQIDNLISYISRRISDFETLQCIDRAVLDEGDKDLWFLWGLIKRDYALGDKIIKGREQWRKALKVTPAKVNPLFDRLIKLKAVRRLAQGKKGAGSKSASQYVRLC